MSRLWDRIFGLDRELSIWVEEEDLGKEKLIHQNKRRYAVKIPHEMDKHVTLRLKGLGRTRIHKSGDLFLPVWLNKGEDVRKDLWLSETLARNGAEKRLFTGGKRIAIVVPPKSHSGLVIRLTGLGTGPSVDWRAPVSYQKKRGDLLVKLCVYPDSITPNYGSFGALSTENMQLEGWVYRKSDEVIGKLGRSSLPIAPIQACAIADLFNEMGQRGWWSIFDALVHHLKLGNVGIQCTTSPSMSLPGSCQGTTLIKDNVVTGYTYQITINERFLGNPFSIAAIMAHELCHVVFAEKIDNTPKTAGYVLKTPKATLEEERTVDLLVFIYGMGEFQLRVARDRGLTLGYFNQELFERIQVIASRKLNSS